jgi:hypothetical protein
MFGPAQLAAAGHHRGGVARDWRTEAEKQEKADLIRGVVGHDDVRESGVQLQPPMPPSPLLLHRFVPCSVVVPCCVSLEIKALLFVLVCSQFAPRLARRLFLFVAFFFSLFMIDK